MSQTLAFRIQLPTLTPGCDVCSRAVVVKVGRNANSYTVGENDCHVEGLEAPTGSKVTVTLVDTLRSGGATPEREITRTLDPSCTCPVPGTFDVEVTGEVTAAEIADKKADEKVQAAKEKEDAKIVKAKEKEEAKAAKEKVAKEKKEKAAQAKKEKAAKAKKK